MPGKACDVWAFLIQWAWESKIKKKKLWQKIAEMMQMHKSNYGSEQCEVMWKTLVRGVKKVSDHNSKTGNSLETHLFEKQLDFLVKQPNMRPSYVIECTNDNSKAVEKNDETSDSDSYSEFSEDSKSLLAPPAPTAAKRKRSNVSEVLDVLKEQLYKIWDMKKKHEKARWNAQWKNDCNETTPRSI